MVDNAYLKKRRLESALGNSENLRYGYSWMSEIGWNRIGTKAKSTDAGSFGGWDFLG